MSSGKNPAVTRRQFVKGAIAGLTVLPLAGMRVSADDAVAALVSEDDAVAQALGYKHDASAVDTAKFPKRAGDAGATQFCDNCSLYAAAGDSDMGACTLFPGKQVMGKGWCNSWLEKKG